MAEFDTIAKHLIHTYPARLRPLRPATRRPRGARHHRHRATHRRNPTRTDSLIRVRLGGEEALVHHEFQTTDSSPPMPAAWSAMSGAASSSTACRSAPSSSICVQRPAGVIRGHYLQERHGFRVLVQYQVIRLSELEGQRMLDEGPAGLLPVCAVDAATGRIRCKSVVASVRSGDRGGGVGRCG